MNPFIYGEVVSGNDFLNREKELKNLVRDLKDGQKVFIISPRRYGKTSLLIKAAEELRRQKVKVAYIDLFKSSSLEQFAASLAKTFAEIKAISLEDRLNAVKDLIAHLRPQFNINPDGSFSIGIDSAPSKREMYQVIEDILNYPQKLSKKDNTAVVVMFDEFQEVSTLGGESLEKLIRSIVQHQRNVGYVFCGSKKHLISEMVNKRSRAFYGIGPVVHLEKIDPAEWVKYLTSKFKEGNLKIEESVIEKIVETGANIPYYVQSLSHEIWDMAHNEKRKIELGDIAVALTSIVKKRSPNCQALWEMLPPTQRRLLEGIAEGGPHNIFARDFLVKHQLKSSAIAQKSLELLLKKDILEKENGGYIFTDLWFGQWIRITFNNDLSSASV